MNEIFYTCPTCKKSFAAPANRAGKTARCWNCGKDIQLPEPDEPKPLSQPESPQIGFENPKQTRTPQSSQPAPAARGILQAGWICFGLGMILLIICVLIPFYGPLFVASFVLSIIAISQKRHKAGLALLFSTIFIPIITGFVIWLLIFGAVSTKLADALPPTQQPINLSGSSRQLSTLPNKTLSLGRLLSHMEQTASGLQSADTSVARDEIITRIRTTTRNVLSNYALAFTATITDIRMISAGKYRISFSDMQDGSFFKNKSSRLQMTPTQSITLQMDNTQARAVHPGQKIIIRAKADLSTRSIPPPNFILNISTKKTYQKVGYLYLQDNVYSIQN
jgi:hypothetical protein